MIDNLLQAYRERVEPRMRDLPIYNAALDVEAVGFERRAGRLCGVLLTPWCMNLLLFPAEDDRWQDLAPGKVIEMEFPSGRHGCMLSVIDGLVPHLSLPLFTTVQHFEDQESARLIALEVLRRMHLDEGRVPHRPDAESPPGREIEQRTMTRRELLRGLGVFS